MPPAKQNTFKSSKDFEKEDKASKGKKRSKLKFNLSEKLAFLKDERFHKVIGLGFILVSIYLLIAFTSFLFTWKTDQSTVLDADWQLFFEVNPDAAENWLGIVGAIISHFFIHKWFGIASFVFVLLSFLLGFRILFKTALLPLGKTFRYSFFGIIWFSATMGLLFSQSQYFLGGAFGYHTYLWLKGLLGTAGTGFFLIFYLLVFLVAVFNIRFERLKKMATEIQDVDLPNPDGELASDSTNVESALPEEQPEMVLEQKADQEVASEPEPVIATVTNEPEPEEEPAPEPVVVTPQETVEPPKEEEAPVISDHGVEVKVEHAEEQDDEDLPERKTLDEPYDPTLDLSSYKYPPLNLLTDYGDNKGNVDSAEINEKTNLIVETLKNYNIEIKKIQATIGPTVTLYEIVPAEGVRISKIKNLEDDIALSLAALGIRIIAPIPGKGTIGIEVPNQNPVMVSIKTVLGSNKFQNSDMELPLALGKTITNEVYISDLAKMPHLLMAGATGQGKSVGINTILTSLLYRKHPSQVKLVLVDPKKVELSLYKNIERHFLAKLPGDGDSIITDTKLVVNTLNSLCVEMDQRYDLLKEAQVRNIKEYNAKFIARKLNPNNGHRFLPYIVVVIDELADLMMTAGKEVEFPIGRLAQLARAIGIHLILATQRPSVNIITGTIKANFPARIAFRVSSKIDSRTILDSNGADQLIGKGDMLFSNGNDLVRLQCAFVDTIEAEGVTEYIGAQRGYSDAYQLPEYVDESANNSGGDFDATDRDVLFEDAARVVVQHQQGSTSLLQRKLKLGYNRAGRLIDQLEHAGIVGPFEGSKAREVLVSDEMALEQFLKTLDEEKS